MSSLLSFVSSSKKTNNSSKKTKKMSKKTSSKSIDNTKANYTRIFIHKMLEMAPTIRLYHWKTESRATHKATDNLQETLNEIVDKYVETLIGKTNVKLDMTDYHTLHVPNLENNKQLEDYVKSIIEFLLDVHKKLDMEKDVDLLNLRDEMIADINKFLYLLRLK